MVKLKSLIKNKRYFYINIDYTPSKKDDFLLQCFSYNLTVKTNKNTKI